MSVKNLKNNARKEKKGIQYLEDLCLKSPYLEPQISSNDKTPSFDGQIMLYKKEMPLDSKGYLKKYLEKVIPIQLKTTEIKTISCNKIKFLVEIEDLKNYYNNDGVLFFIVAFESENEDNVVLFYNDFTPLKLEDILDKNKKDSGKIQLEFVKLNTDIENVVRNFCISVKKQKGFDFEHNRLISLSTWEDLNRDFERIDIRCNILDNRIFSAEVYGKDRKTGFLIPFNFEMSKNIVKNGIIGKYYQVKVKDTVFYNVENRQSVIDFSQNKNISLKLSENLLMNIIKNRIEFKISFVGTVYSILYDLKFLSEALVNKYIIIDNMSFNITGNLNVLNILKDYVSYFSFFNAMLKIKFNNCLGVKMSDIENFKINCIDDLYSKQLKTTNENGFSVINVSIDKETVGYIVKYNSRDNIYYYSFYDFLNLKQRMYVGNTKENSVLVKSFSMLFYALFYFDSIREPFIKLNEDELECLLNSVNNIEKIEKEAIDFYNNCILCVLKNSNCIQDENLKSKLFIFIEKLYLYILENSDKEDKINYAYKRINYLQIIKRIRKLNSDEIEELKNIYKDCESDDVITKMGVDILLEDWVDLEVMYSKIEEENKSIISSWPIYDLIPKNINL